MGTDRDEVVADALGARPYQARPLRAVGATVTTHDETVVRPYVLTGGRTRSSNALIGFETMVTLTPAGQVRRAQEGNERRAILDRCNRPISVVELSAHLRVPLGVAQVLTGDLADEGCLQVHAAPTAPSRDRALLERLARAVQNKQAEVA
jgi:hypothetical protein